MVESYRAFNYGSQLQFLLKFQALGRLDYEAPSAFCLVKGALIWIAISEAYEKWGLTTRRVQKMCSEGKIKGVIKFGRAWVIPGNTDKPPDGRVTTGEYRNWRKKNDKE